MLGQVTYLQEVVAQNAQLKLGGPVWQNILYTKETGWLDEKAKQECKAEHH